MPICGRCGDEVTDAIQCSACFKYFDYQCSGITEKGYRKLGDRQATWRCVNCKTTGHASTAAASPRASPSITLESIMQELQTIRFELAPLASLTSEVQLIRKELTELKQLPSRIEALDERLINVEASQVAAQQLKPAITHLEAWQHETDQWMRGNNIEIKGVPIKDRENLFDIVAKIGAVITYPISKHQINFVHRVPTYITGTKNIIVAFTTKYIKEDFIAAARLLKSPLSIKDIGMAGPGRIFINDHLTAKNKALLSQAKTQAKEHNFQFVWVKHMKIFVRRDPMSKPFVITSDQDLQKIR